MSNAYIFRWVFTNPNTIGPGDLEKVVGVVGPPGLPGDALSVIAAEPLGGHRAVTVDGYHVTPLTLDHIGGITVAAGAMGDIVEYKRSGFLHEPSWNWTPGQPIFIGPAGVLTQTPPTGVIRRIAWPVSPTEINIDLHSPIQLA